MTLQPLQDISCPRCETRNARNDRWCRRCRTPLGGSTDAPNGRPVSGRERWKRLAAWLVDLPLSPAAFVAGMFSADMGGPAIATLALLVLGIVGVPYQVALLRREGQTVGKFLLRIRIVDEETGVKGTLVLERRVAVLRQLALDHDPAIRRHRSRIHLRQEPQVRPRLFGRHESRSGFYQDLNVAQDRAPFLSRCVVRCEGTLAWSFLN